MSAGSTGAGQTCLTARAERVGQSAMRALAAGDWDTAAEWEEQRILSQDEVGRLLLEHGATNVHSSSSLSLAYGFRAPASRAGLYRPAAGQFRTASRAAAAR